MTTIIDGYCTLGTEREAVLTREDLLRSMDTAGIEKAVVAPQDREIAVRNQQGNERILREAQRAHGRFIPACTVNPWHGAEALDIVRSAVRDGARLLVLSPALQGFLPIDELVDPLMDLAVQLALPVYFHTGPHHNGGPTQVILLAARHPRTVFILGHCGSTDHAWDMPTILTNHALGNVWYELSFVRPWGSPAYLGTSGGRRLIFGSGAPRNDPVFELREFDRAIPISEHPDTYGKNLLTVLNGEADS